MCPEASHCFKSFSLIGSGVSPAGTDIQRWNSSKPGAEKIKVTLSGGPVFIPANTWIGLKNTSAEPLMKISFLLPQRNVRGAGVDQQEFVFTGMFELSR